MTVNIDFNYFFNIIGRPSVLLALLLAGAAWDCSTACQFSYKPVLGAPNNTLITYNTTFDTAGLYPTPVCSAMNPVFYF